MKNKAFTLAEVLLTLGIIGVIAALTMPAFISKAARAKIGPELVHTKTVLENAISQYLVDNSADYLRTAIQRNKPNIESSDITSALILGEIIGSDNTKYLRGTAKNGGDGLAYNGALDEETESAVVTIKGGSGYLLTGGTAVAVSGDPCALTAVDSKCPLAFYTSSVERVIAAGKSLTAGKEVFLFELYSDGRIEPMEEDGSCGDNIKKAELSGKTCAARIAKNDWKVDY